jgi:pyrroloquinoline quinone biosynthesis protein E
MELSGREAELSTDAWVRVFREAAGLGMLQVDLTGGEPLARSDIVELTRAGRSAGLYVSLITSGLPLTENRLAALVDAGLDHFQLSFQGATESTAHEIASSTSHANKLVVLQWLKKHRIGVTLNFVIHRRNIHELEQMIALVEDYQPGCAEFASVQYYGWGFANKEALLPTRSQLDHCVATLKAAEDRLKGKTRMVFVVPDYYAKYPKACVGGWGRKLMLVSPDGSVLPCHAARVIAGLHFENVKYKPLRDIWDHSPAFRRFRGEDWMKEPCRSCDRRQMDFGGCRCQAFLLTGDACATDPVCSLAPARGQVDQILKVVNEQPRKPDETPRYLYRRNPD